MKNISVKINIVIFLAGVISGFFLFRHPEIKTTETVKTKTQTVTTILKPDGTKITKTEDKVQNKNLNKTEVKNDKSKYRLTGSYDIQKQSYGIGAETRLIGPVWLGLDVNQLGSVQVRVGVEF